MPDRREFIKLFGISAAAMMFCPGDILNAESREFSHSIRLKYFPRIHYGNKRFGCAGWCGNIDGEYLFDFDQCLL